MIRDELHALLRERLALPDGGELDDALGLLGQGLGLDSIEVLQLVAAIEERFGLTVDDDALAPDRFRTVGTLLQFVTELLS